MYTAVDKLFVETINKISNVQAERSDTNAAASVALPPVFRELWKLDCMRLICLWHHSASVC